MNKNNDRFMKEAERIYIEWDKALSNRDVEAFVGLYTKDAILESPLIPLLMKKEQGICVGHDEIREVISLVFQRNHPMRKYYRTGYFTDGKTLMWEYPRKTPEGEQLDIVEVIEIKDGLIGHQRIYWGWKGLKILQENAYNQ